MNRAGFAGRAMQNAQRGGYANFNNDVDLPLSEEPYFGVADYSPRPIGGITASGADPRGLTVSGGGSGLGHGDIGSYFSGPMGGYLPNMPGYTGPPTILPTNWTRLNWGPGAAAMALPASGGGPAGGLFAGNSWSGGSTFGGMASSSFGAFMGAGGNPRALRKF